MNIDEAWRRMMMPQDVRWSTMKLNEAWWSSTTQEDTLGRSALIMVTKKIVYRKERILFLAGSVSKKMKGNYIARCYKGRRVRTQRHNRELDIDRNGE